ncbi:MAG: hypothetical protein HY664_00185 [Chloroflexi bacterium]|nr:hypothetical protein [Chloroflexota bacterium]
MIGSTSEGPGLSDGDLDFVIGEAAPEFPDKAKLKQLIKEDVAFRKGIISDERVFRKVMADKEVILRISSALYFEILLRKALKELEKASHTVEKAGTQTVAVFDTKEVANLLSKPPVLNYLAGMLSSFTRIESYIIPVRIRKGIWRKIRFNDMDIDSIIRFCQAVGEEHRLSLYKRIADICLFILGIFPEFAPFDYSYPLSGERRTQIAGRVRRGIEDYEEEGRKFYKLAAEHPSARTLKLSEVFWLLHENFNAAKKPLNFIADHYIYYEKQKLFGIES